MRACSTQLQLQAVGPALGPVSLTVLFPWGPPIGPLLVPGLPAPLLRALSTFVMFACVVLLGSPAAGASYRGMAPSWATMG